jgi:hypothetical protein
MDDGRMSPVLAAGSTLTEGAGSVVDIAATEAVPVAAGAVGGIALAGGAGSLVAAGRISASRKSISGALPAYAN